MNGVVNDSDNFEGSGASLVPGKFGNALQLDGNGSSVDVNNPITDLGGNSTWSMSVWVKTTTPGVALVSKDDGGTDWTTGNSVFYLGH